MYVRMIMYVCNAWTFGTLMYFGTFKRLCQGHRCRLLTETSIPPTLRFPTPRVSFEVSSCTSSWSCCGFMFDGLPRTAMDCPIQAISREVWLGQLSSTWRGWKVQVGHSPGRSEEYERCCVHVCDWLSTPNSSTGEYPQNTGSVNAEEWPILCSKYLQIFTSAKGWEPPLARGQRTRIITRLNKPSSWIHLNKFIWCVLPMKDLMFIGWWSRTVHASSFIHAENGTELGKHLRYRSGKHIPGFGAHRPHSFHASWFFESDNRDDDNYEVCPSAAHRSMNIEQIDEQMDRTTRSG